MMVRDASLNLRTVSSIQVRDASNLLRTVSSVQVRDASNNLRNEIVVGGMTVTAEPAGASGYGYSHGSITVSTGSVTASVDGGTGPYAYAWNSSGGTMEAVSPSSATTTFRGGPIGPGDALDDSFICTVTDAHGNVAYSNAVTTSVSNNGT